MAINNLILTGGINHDFEDASKALAGVLAQSGIESTIFSDFDEGLDAIGDGPDLVTLFALRWRMLDHDKYIPFREEWAYEISERHRELLSGYIRNGGGLLGLHTTAICFDTWPEWQNLLGAKWIWGSSFHPEPATLEIVNLDQRHPTTSGLSEFQVMDELYHNIQPAEGATPLFQAVSAEDDSLQTLAWAQAVGRGRSVYSALAHDRQSIETEGHSKFLQQAAGWLAGEKS
ncbi:MAG: ThuA domain-containing protein [Pseudomonadales bacterium]|jgi:type 1 glutamine amidotransferase|nr:ThuA domain-containing protein [Pseudomonadales bacterium]